jgi:4a-hydroxytetrahydrobiopterin dehydratase
MTSELLDKRCKPCEEGAEPLKGEALDAFRKHLPEGWQIVDEHHLEKSYTFKNFVDALAFTNRVGDVAEREGHHPDIYLTWGEVQLKVWTHKAGGLTENDFSFANKAERAK